MLPAPFFFFFGGCKVFPMGMLHDGPRLSLCPYHPCWSWIKALPNCCGGDVLKHLFNLISTLLRDA